MQHRDSLGTDASQSRLYQVGKFALKGLLLKAGLHQLAQGGSGWPGQGTEQTQRRGRRDFDGMPEGTAYRRAWSKTLAAPQCGDEFGDSADIRRPESPQVRGH